MKQIVFNLPIENVRPTKCSDDSEFEFIKNQIIANMPYNATEIVSFLK